jgi:hypothetical protein
LVKAATPAFDAVEIDGEDLAPRRVIHLHEALVRVDARVVHEDVEMAEFLQHFLRHPERVRIVADVGLCEHRAAAHLLDVLDDVARRPLARHVVHRDVGAFLGERERDGASDSAAATGDERGAILEPHRESLLRKTERAESSMAVVGTLDARC